MQLRVSATPASCPDCGHDVAWHHVRSGRSFGCPTCLTPLRVRGAYTRTLNIAATAISFLLSYALGLRDWPLIVVGFLGMFPIQIVMTLITLRLFSVEFEATGEFRDILYPADSQIDDDAVPISLPERSPVALKLWELFKDINQPPTLEGYALQSGIVIMTIFVVWSLAVALLHGVFPGFDRRAIGSDRSSHDCASRKIDAVLHQRVRYFLDLPGGTRMERVTGAFVYAGETSVVPQCSRGASTATIS